MVLGSGAARGFHPLSTALWFQLAAAAASSWCVHHARPAGLAPGPDDRYSAYTTSAHHVEWPTVQLWDLGSGGEVMAVVAWKCSVMAAVELVGMIGRERWLGIVGGDISTGLTLRA